MNKVLPLNVSQLKFQQKQNNLDTYQISLYLLSPVFSYAVTEIFGTGQLSEPEWDVKRPLWDININNSVQTSNYFCPLSFKFINTKKSLNLIVSAKSECLLSSKPVHESTLVDFSSYILTYLIGVKISLYLKLWCTNWSSHKFSKCWTGTNLGFKIWHQTYASIVFFLFLRLHCYLFCLMLPRLGC